MGHGEACGGRYFGLIFSGYIVLRNLLLILPVVERSLIRFPAFPHNA